MKKILFYTANGVGLGHIRRSSLIAKAIKELDKSSEVFFASMCKDASFLEELSIPYQKLIPVSDEIIKDYEENQRCKKTNEQKLFEIIERFQPNTIVLDIHVFANFSFPNSILLEKYKNIKKILIYRMTNRENYVKNFEKFGSKFKVINKIIIPHRKSELKKALSSEDFDYLDKNDIIRFSGPIYRRLDKSVLLELKKRYNIKENDLNLTIALGGGGELKEGKCETPAGIILSFLKDYNELTNRYPNLKIRMVTGPLFKHKKICNLIKYIYGEKIQIERFEVKLLELFSLSDLVISPIGYNAGNEIIEARTSALLVPLLRGEDNSSEQLERANFLEKFGFVKVFKNNSGSNFGKLLADCIEDLPKMQKAIDDYEEPIRGNEKSAKIILE